MDNLSKLVDQTEYQEVSLDGKLRYIDINPATTVVSPNPRDVLSLLPFAPRKIRTRFMLNSTNRCGLGTVFIPPNVDINDTTLEWVLNHLNRVNFDAKRPLDSDLILRTANYNCKTGAKWSDPAFLIGREGVKRLDDFSVVFDLSSELNILRSSWKLLHSDNLGLQRTALHGRLFYEKGRTFNLDIGDGVPHARSLEKGGGKHIINIGGLFSPLRVKNVCVISLNPIGLISKGRGMFEYIDDFVTWGEDGNKLPPKYVAEFRYYTQNCDPLGEFHVMDVDERF